MHASADTDAPAIAEMNTTPLVDVMLVLLIMFIVTIPLQTHAVKLDLPTRPPETRLEINSAKNKLVVTASGAILWNGKPVSRQALRLALETTTQMRPVPELHVEPEAHARYELVDEVLAITKQARIEKMGFVGNERYASY